MTRRLIYLYVSNGAAEYERIPKQYTMHGTVDACNVPSWNPRISSTEQFCDRFKEEGFCYLFKKFIERKLFDEILVVIESNRSPGSFKISEGINGLVVPHIDCLWDYVTPDDILWARGGWKSWFPFLEKWHELDRWLLFYRAASNRGAWTFWDIVLDDLRLNYQQDIIGRFYYPFNKPIDPTIFFHRRNPSLFRSFDLMIGASHIHDKKGQWRILSILIEYRKLFGANLMCIMPGSIKRGTETSHIFEVIDRNKLNVHTPGMLSRKQLSEIYASSKIFVHCGAGGQNDRSPLEALFCGTPIMLANPEYHAPCIRPGYCPVSFDIDPKDTTKAAEQIHSVLARSNNEILSFHDQASAYIQSANSIETSYWQFETLFKRIFSTPHSRRQDLYDIYLDPTIDHSNERKSYETETPSND